MHIPILGSIRVKTGSLKCQTINQLMFVACINLSLFERVKFNKLIGKIQREIL